MIRRIFSTSCAALFSLGLFAQQIDASSTTGFASGQDLSNEYNVITTAVSFLTITPDSRSGAMGDAGAATTPDVYSQHSNASKYALAEDDFGVGLSYTPWLSNLGIKDINLIYLSGYKKLSKKEAIGASLCYFSLGDIPAYDEDGNPAGYTISPQEYSLDASYSRFLADNFVMGMTARFIYSNLTGGTQEDYHAGKAVAADISGTYFNEFKGSLPGLLTVGFNISNIGSKISYSEDNKDFIPANLKLGVGYNAEIDQYNKVGVYFDINKLLVPTPPQNIYDGDGNIIGIEGKDDEVSVPQGIFQSFYDAPGGFKEEMKEFTLSLGAEYWYNNQFAARLGYFNESKTKGDRKYFTAGAGLRLNVFGLDFSYLIPINGKNSPLANTFRFSLTFDFEGTTSNSRR
ncbi:MAG: type IX secretion system outer membrane channel protein PorV [Bacteroidales bacterium]|nr:type IX secretion system outer membrane channel protein PorV [Bacteroidales bacterium]